VDGPLGGPPLDWNVGSSKSIQLSVSPQRLPLMAAPENRPLRIERQAFESHGSLAGVIARPELLAPLRAALRRSPVVVLVGRRPWGQTTAARWIVRPDSAACFDLKAPTRRRKR
jgi:hypothetical protein